MTHVPATDASRTSGPSGRRSAEGVPITPSTVVVTGASGLLGSWLLRTAPEDRSVVPAVHRRPTGAAHEIRVDLRDREATVAAIAATRPDLLVHAAYAKDEASIVDATRNIVEAARATGAGLIHVSTDAVFRGDGAARPEPSEPDPVSDYGRWKADAEAVVRQLDPPAAVVRLPLIVSHDPLDHVAAAILDGAATGRPTTWFTDEVRQPAMADDIAGAVWRIAALDDVRRAGTWHLPGPERLTRHEIARRILAALQLGDDVILAEPAPASDPRPRDLHLGDDRARAEIGWSPRPIFS